MMSTDYWSNQEAKWEKEYNTALKSFFKNEFGEENLSNFEIGMRQGHDDDYFSYKLNLYGMFFLYGERIDYNYDVPIKKLVNTMSLKERELLLREILKPWIDKISEFDKMRENKLTILHIESKDDFMRVMCRNQMRDLING